jgi:hypothetical protein
MSKSTKRNDKHALPNLGEHFKRKLRRDMDRAALRDLKFRLREKGFAL